MNTSSGHGQMQQKHWRWIELPTYADARGALTVIERDRTLPFSVERSYWLHGVAAGEARGAHAHRQLEQIFVAVAGRLVIDMDDGVRKDTVELGDPARALYMGPRLWHTLREFSPGAVCLVLAAARYDEADYFRDHAQFLAAVRG